VTGKSAGRLSDAEIEAQLHEFLAGHEVWPTYREFVAAMQRPLREAITHRGARYWAKRVGVKWVKHSSGYSPIWTEERVSGELEPFLAGREVWPTVAEFEAAGLGLLREAVKRLGGVQVWAARFGLQRPNHSVGSTRIWDHERLELAVGPLVRSLGRWPTKSEFRHAGLASAQSSLYRYGGVAYWRAHFGVSANPRNGRVPDRRVWTEQRIESELRAYCKGRTHWPRQQDFVRDGKGRLYKAASLHGGIARWQKELGLRPPVRTYSGVYADARPKRRRPRS
jgi:hypothetical protein